MRFKLRLTAAAFLAGCLLSTSAGAVVIDTTESGAAGNTASAAAESTENTEPQSGAESTDTQELPGLRKYQEPAEMKALDDLNIRTGPDTAAQNVAGILHNGDTVQALGVWTDEEGGLWYLVLFDEKECYAFGEFLSFAGEEPAIVQETEPGNKEEDLNAAAETTADSAAASQEEAQTQADEPAAGPMLQLQTVGTEDVPSLENEGHGWLFTTYSDGSIKVEEY